MGWFPFGKKGSPESREFQNLNPNTNNDNTTPTSVSVTKTEENNKDESGKLSKNTIRNKSSSISLNNHEDNMKISSFNKIDSDSTTSTVGNEDQDNNKTTGKSYLFGLVTEVNPGGLNNTYKINIPGVKSTNDNTKCVNMVNQSIKEQKIQFLAKSLDELGCSFSWSEMIECEPCTELCHAMFQGNEKGLKEGDYKPKLTVCENYMISKSYTTRAIAHELIHAYDQCRAKLDFKNIDHLACTEIRAAALSGDCDIAAEFDRGNFKLKGQHQACVKRRAIAAITTGVQDQDKKMEGKENKKKLLVQRPVVDEVAATLAVEKVWSECYKDTNPFPGIPPP